MLKPVTAQTDFKEYVSEPLGIKLKIPLQWQVVREYNSTEYCGELSKYGYCNVTFVNDDYDSGNLSYVTMISKVQFTGSLKEFVAQQYNLIKDDPLTTEFLFINDKQIIFNNSSAWEMEYVLAIKKLRLW